MMVPERGPGDTGRPRLSPRGSGKPPEEAGSYSKLSTAAEGGRVHEQTVRQEDDWNSLQTRVRVGVETGGSGQGRAGMASGMETHAACRDHPCGSEDSFALWSEEKVQGKAEASSLGKPEASHAVNAVRTRRETWGGGIVFE